jgi:hypothetical protein
LFIFVKNNFSYEFSVFGANVNLITVKNAVNIEIIAAWIFSMTVLWLVRVGREISEISEISVETRTCASNWFAKLAK